MKLKKTTIVFIVIDLVIILVLGLMIGPLKNKIIANNFSKHVFISSLYKTRDINKTLADKTVYKINNKYEKEVKEVEIEKSKINEYDIQILTPDEGNNDYKLMNLKIAGYDAFLVAIYDPTKVHVVTKETLGTQYGERLTVMCNRYGGSVCINGGYFVDNGYGSGIPSGYVIENGKIRWTDGNAEIARGDIIGITKEGKLKLMKNTTGAEALAAGVTDGIEFGPFLIIDGKAQDVAGNVVGGYTGAARAAIAQRRDGIMLFLVTNGYHGNGATMGELIDALVKYGAYNAANLDGGASSSLTINGNLINTPRNIYGNVITGGRTLVDGFGLILK